MQRSQRLSSLHSHPHFPKALAILEKLKSKGHETYFAGGCVRDALRGKPAKDIDIATSAHPDQVIKLFPKTVELGKEFGVIGVVMGKDSFEVASFRSDGPYLDGRRPSKIKFSSPEMDAQRRDFTINALFYDPINMATIDYVDGLKDLDKEIIRTVGTAADRFREDKLRMLRAIRFVAQTGFALEGTTLQAIQAHASEIHQVSAERVFQEMSKLLSAPYWIRGIELLKVSGLARALWPEWNGSSESARLKTLGLPLNWEHAFAATMWFAKAVRQVEARLNAWKAPKASTRKVQNIMNGLHILLETEATVSERMRVIDSAEFAEVLSIAKLHLVRVNKNVDGVNQWINEFLERTGESAKLPSPLVSGDDLLQLGFIADKRMGQVLKLLYDEQLQGLINSKPEALKRAEMLRQV